MNRCDPAPHKGHYLPPLLVGQARGAVRGDKLSFQAIAAHQGREVSACEDEAVIRPQQALLIDPAERAEPVDQGVFERGTGRGRLAQARQMPAQKLARMAVDHQGE